MWPRPWRIALALLMSCVAPLAIAQTTCPALGPTTGIPRDSARLSWDPVTQWQPTGTPPVCPGTPANCNIPTPTGIVYTVYERVGTVDTVVCTTTNLGTTLAGLSVGTHFWLATAKTPQSNPPNIESSKAGPVSKVIDPPLTTPGQPGNITVQ